MNFSQKWGKILVGSCLALMGQAFAMDAWVDAASSKAPADTTIEKKTYYKIGTAAELAWFMKQTDLDNQDTTVSINAILTADIDLGGKLWTPIAPGTGLTIYNGTFDGNGHSISNLYIKGSELSALYEAKGYENYKTYLQNLGLFGTINATVKNLALLDVSIETSQDQGIIAGDRYQISTGALVAYSISGTLDHIYTTGTITVSGYGQGVGGIVGTAKSVKLTNSLSRVQLIASGNKSYLGGLIGVTESYSTIQFCVYDGPAIVNTGDNSVSAALIGYYKSGSANVTSAFYDEDILTDSLGIAVSELNTSEVVCQLNGGTWENEVCSNETSNVWSEGFSQVSLFGADGYWVTFDANGGDFSEFAKTTKTVLANAAITAEEIETPTRDDYFFVGWALSAEATEAEDLGTATAKTTVYAVWDAGYTVAFNSTSGIFSDSETVQTVKVATNGVISVDGFDPLTTYEDDESVKHYFTGWAYTENATVDDTLNLARIVLNETNTAIDAKTKTLNLYAVWTSDPTYTVTFNANGHATPNVQSVVVTSSKEITAPSVTAANGYKLVGWYTDADCSEGKEYTFGATTEENITLYAKWKATSYSITYNLNGGTNGNNPASYTVESFTITLKNAKRDGYTFAGWFYDKDLTNAASQITAGSTGDVTLYAKWKALTYSIYYLAGKDAYGTVAADTKAYGESIKLKNSTGAFVREGYLLAGWATSDGGEKVYDFGATYDKNSNLILYAVWVDDPNSIPVLKSQKVNLRRSQSNVWYDLRGRKLGQKPTVQGTYFYNGKRIVVK